METGFDISKQVEDAATMLVNCIKWRKEFGVDTIFEEKYPDAITSLGFIHKTDNQGIPLFLSSTLSLFLLSSSLQ